MRVNGKNIAFALANTAAVFVALFVAFASDLERALRPRFNRDGASIDPQQP